MNWVKRNIIFTVSLVVALILIGVGIFFVIAKRGENTTLEEELQTALSGLSTVYSSPAHPGNNEINNLALAKTNLNRIQTFLGEARAVFGGDVGPTNMSDSEFKAQL